MTALGRGEVGRRKKAKSLPSPLGRTAQRQKKTLTEEVVVVCIRK